MRSKIEKPINVATLKSKQSWRKQNKRALNAKQELKEKKEQKSEETR